jgi:hypothetical protein
VGARTHLLVLSQLSLRRADDVTLERGERGRGERERREGKDKRKRRRGDTEGEGK